MILIRQKAIGTSSDERFDAWGSNASILLSEVDNDAYLKVRARKGFPRGRMTEKGEEINRNNRAIYGDGASSGIGSIIIDERLSRRALVGEGCATSQ